MRRSFSFLFFLVISVLAHWVVLFRTPNASAHVRSAASGAVSTIEAILTDIAQPEPAAPFESTPEPPPESTEKAGSADYQVASDEIDELAEVTEPTRDREVESDAERPPAPPVDPVPVDTAGPPTEVRAMAECTIASLRAHDDFWDGLPARGRDDQGEMLPNFLVDPFPDARTWAVIARDVRGRVVAYDPASMDEYLLVDLMSDQHRRRVIRGPADYPTVGYSTAGFDLRSLPKMTRLAQDLRLSADRLIVMMQMPPDLARRLDQKVALLAENVGWSSEEIMSCRGRWRQAPFGPWIFEIQEVVRRGGDRRMVRDPEADRIFGRSG